MSGTTSTSRLRTFLISDGEKVTIGHLYHSGMSNLPAPHYQLLRNTSHANCVERSSAVESYRLSAQPHEGEPLQVPTVPIRQRAAWGVTLLREMNSLPADIMELHSVSSSPWRNTNAHFVTPWIDIRDAWWWHIWLGKFEPTNSFLWHWKGCDLDDGCVGFCYFALLTNFLFF